MSNVEYGTMELLKNRSQQKCAKIVIIVLMVVIIIIVIHLFLKNSGESEDVSCIESIINLNMQLTNGTLNHIRR